MGTLLRRCRCRVQGGWTVLGMGPFFIGHYGGFLVLTFENELPVLLLMIVLKVIADVKAHLDEHKPARVSDEASAAAP